MENNIMQNNRESSARDRFRERRFYLLVELYSDEKTNEIATEHAVAGITQELIEEDEKHDKVTAVETVEKEVKVPEQIDESIFTKAMKRVDNWYSEKFITKILSKR